MAILNSLDKNKIINNYEVVDFKIFEFGFYIKIVVFFIDSTELYIKEYSDENERNYSYHWQTKNGKLITRWDNAPHHKGLKTYPHHKHFNGKILDNYNVTIDEILKEIELEIKI